MEALINRYRNLSVLLIAIAVQLILIAYQVRTRKDVPFLRVWAVTAVTPVEQALEFVRRNTIGVAEDYFVLIGTRSENDRLKKQVDALKLEKHYLEDQLATADRAKALAAFQAQSPSRTLAARIIGNGTGSNSKVVFIDRGSASGVESGMAVITPDGIVGKVVEAYPTASLVMLITDPTFAAGVISQKGRVRGTLKGQGHAECIVDYVQNEQKVEPGEWFYTSGDDRIFPRGFPVGKVDVARNGKTFKEIFVSPSTFQNGLEEVLVVLQGTHQPIPETEIATPGIKILPPPPDASPEEAEAKLGLAALSTSADRVRAEYKKSGEEQNHVFGEGLPGSKPPDFTGLGRPSARPAASPAVVSKTNPSPAEPPPAPKPGTVSAAGPPPARLGAADKTNPALEAAGQRTVTGAVSEHVQQMPRTGAPEYPAAVTRPRRPLLVTDPADAAPDPNVVVNRQPRVRDTQPTPPLDDYGQPRPTPKPKPAKPASTAPITILHQ